MDITMYNLICNSVLAILLPFSALVLGLLAKKKKNDILSSMCAVLSACLCIISIVSWIILFTGTLPDALLKLGYIVKS